MREHWSAGNGPVDAGARGTPRRVAPAPAPGLHRPRRRASPPAARRSRRPAAAAASADCRRAGAATVAVRPRVAQMAARRHRAEHGIRAQNGDGAGLVSPSADAGRWPPEASGLESRLPSGSERVRRALREQRVAAGAAEIAHEIDLGQRRAGISGHRRAALAHQRRRRRAQTGRPHDPDASAGWRPDRRPTRSRCISATGARAPAAPATATGFNVNPLRTTAALDILTGVELVKTGETLSARVDAGSLVA